MTSTTDATGTAEHPEVAELSELAEGLLSPSRTTQVRRHLDDCELCADVLDSLEEIRALLGTLPGPPRMPADIAGRIDAALAAEALLDTMAPGSGAGQDTSRPSETPAASAVEPVSGADRSDGPVSHETTPTGPAPGTDDVSHETTPAPRTAPAGERPAGRPRGSSGPGRPARTRRGRRRVAVLGTVVAAAAIGVGTFLVPSLFGGGSDGDAGKTQASDSAPSYSEGRLERQVTDLLGGENNAESAPGSDEPSVGMQSSPDSPKSNTPMREKSVQVPPCIAQGIDRPEAPLAIERGTYRGDAAFLVVLPHASDSSRVAAYVVDAACTQQKSAGGGDVLLTESYPRR